MKILFRLLRNHSLPRAIGVALLLAGLVNCSTAPSATSAARVPPNTLQQLLDKAHAAPMTSRAPYLIDAANLALRLNQLPQSEHILQEIDELKLRDGQRAQSVKLHAQLLLLQGKPEAAAALLQTQEFQTDSEQLSAREQTDISLLRAKAFAAAGQFYASAQERIFVDPLLKDAEREQNHQGIQRALMNLSAADLQKYRDSAGNETLRGWLTLALAAKTNQAAPVSDWVRKWPAHPATEQTMAGASAFSAGDLLQPQQIALLLPQSGRLTNFGDAVRDGFFAAWYAAKSRGETLPAVRIYDTENAGIVALYQQAIQDGATLVIGPLEKNQVAQFYSQTLAVPLLALNRAETTQIPPANLYQFALAPENETEQIATLAYKQNRADALVIVAEDEARSNELEAFVNRWQSLGGNIAAQALYRDQQSLSTAIRSALNIPRSEARGKEMESLLNRNIEFSPHRRRDIDMVFMLAKPAQARLIKPLLNFYYAGDLPIYSTSRIYSGYPSPNEDRDAEGIFFTEIPWVLQQSPLKQQILADRPASKNYLRLYALGVDSFALYPHLRQMEASPGVILSAQTGALSLDQRHVVQRQLPLAQMREGVPLIVNGNGIITESANREDNAKLQNITQQ